MVKGYNLLNKQKIHESTIKMYIQRESSSNKKQTRKCKRIDEKSPFGKIRIIHSGGKNHQWKLKLVGISLRSNRIFP